MGYFRFYRRARILPGLSLNISKSGPSITMGVRGLHYTVGTSGVRYTAGIPGTGLYYTSHHGLHTGFHSQHSDVPLTPAQQRTGGMLAGCAILAVVLLVVLVIGLVAGAMLSAPSSGGGAG